MYRLELDSDFSAAHSLRDYPGVCANTHGHNWKYSVTLETDQIDGQGMTVDYAILKEILDRITAIFEHKNINEQIPHFLKTNPTSEMISRYIFEVFAKELEDRGLNKTVSLVQVRIRETSAFAVTYRP